jgi:thiopeptide-type bacteriocin biosynthesis protein
LLKGDNISATTKKIIPAISSGRNFPIGSEWVYFSIYTGTATADKILLSYVYPLAEQLLRDKFISKWFFIRYNNPKFHLRVRFQLLQKRKYGKLVEDLEKVLSPLISSLQINDISLNMYKREIERYGERTMKFCESLFYLNSMCVLKLISQFSEGKLDSKKQLMIALYGCNQILNDFMFSRESNLKLCRYNQLSFAKEFNVENRTTLKEQLKNEYRNNKNALENIVVNCNLHESPEVFEIDWNRIKKIFDEQSEQTQELISQVIKLLELDDSLTLYELVTSLIHMFVNRLFQTKNRYNEFLIYDYLNKFYESEMNRKDLKGITREI